MKTNPVELLSIVNPEDDEKIVIGKRECVILGLGAAVGAFLMWFARRSTVQQQIPSGTSASSVSSWMILGVLGVAGWYVWSKYKAPEPEPEPELQRNPGKRYHRREKSPAGGARYFVRVVGTDEVYPKPGSKDYPGGYSLRSAQDFARIGSQTGAARKVLRGSSHGPVVRKYEDGKRVWPVTITQARSLRPAERPSKLRESA